MAEPESQPLSAAVKATAQMASLRFPEAVAAKVAREVQPVAGVFDGNDVRNEPFPI